MRKTVPPLTQSVPLIRTKDGVFRILCARVSLDSIVQQFRSGATAEQIQEDFPSVSLSDVYSVIAYYLQHEQEVDNYLTHQRDQASQLRREIEKTVKSDTLRERLRR